MSGAPRVLVTGAGGFLGRHVCRALAAAGDSVRGLVRREVPPPAPGVEMVLGDVLDGGAIRRAVVGVDAVVHLAARVHVFKDEADDPQAEFRRVNVEGTRCVVEEALRAGARRLVFASTFQAVGDETSEAWVEETTPAPTDHYGVSKLEAEHLVMELTRGTALGAAILRPPPVYGPGMKGNMLRLFQLVNRGFPLPLGAVSNRRSLLFAGNFAAAVHAVLGSPDSAGETFFVTDAEAVSTPDLVREIARALGKRARLFSIPQGVIRAVARAADLVLGPAGVPALSAAVGRLLGSLEIDSSKLSRMVGFQLPFTLREGMTETAAWFRSRQASS